MYIEVDMRIHVRSDYYLKDFYQADGQIHGYVVTKWIHEYVVTEHPLIHLSVRGCFKVAG